MMAFSRLSRFGMTFAPLTDDRGADLLMWFRAGFRAKPIPARLLEKTMLTISGRRCFGWWQMSLPGTYLPKTSSGKQWTKPQTILSRWVTQCDALPFQRLTWVQTTFGVGTGYVHTPTCTANYSAPSMQKHACAREFVKVFGDPSPQNQEWLMGWPTNWTDLKPLATDKFHSAPLPHGKSLKVA
jgi:hypothetical protein